MELPGTAEQSVNRTNLASSGEQVSASLNGSSSEPFDKPEARTLATDHASSSLPEAGNDLETGFPPQEGSLAQARPTHHSPVRIRVLLADDHRILREGLASLLEEEPDFEIVGQAADGQEAVELAHHTHPDVILMDITMPRLDGVGATHRLRAELPGVAVIGLSMHEGDQMAEAMRAAGAVAYLTKGGSSEVLLETIRTCRFQ